MTKLQKKNLKRLTKKGKTNTEKEMVAVILGQDHMKRGETIIKKDTDQQAEIEQRKSIEQEGHLLTQETLVEVMIVEIVGDEEIADIVAEDQKLQVKTVALIRETENIVTREMARDEVRNEDILIGKVTNKVKENCLLI